MSSIPLAELEERRQGLERLQAAYKALADEFWTEDGPSYFDRWGRAMKMPLSRIGPLAAEAAAAESIAESMAVEAREKVSHWYSNM